MSLARFLLLERSELEDKLRRLHAVIDTPQNENAPLSLVHLSFRDFLLSEERSRGSSIRIEESSTHLEAFQRCLALMRGDLHQDMCNLILPGRIVSDNNIDRNQLDTRIPAALRYACCYWVDHLAKLNNNQRVKAGLQDDGEVHKFLREKLLFWLETMGLIGKTSTAVLIVNSLGTLVKVSYHPIVCTYIHYLG